MVWTLNLWVIIHVYEVYSFLTMVTMDYDMTSLKIYIKFLLLRHQFSLKKWRNFKCHTLVVSIISMWLCIGQRHKRISRKIVSFCPYFSERLYWYNEWVSEAHKERKNFPQLSTKLFFSIYVRCEWIVDGDLFVLIIYFALQQKERSIFQIAHSRSTEKLFSYYMIKTVWQKLWWQLWCDEKAKITFFGTYVLVIFNIRFHEQKCRKRSVMTIWVKIFDDKWLYMSFFWRVQKHWIVFWLFNTLNWTHWERVVKFNFFFLFR